jgi:NADH-quinone oxidoreductase subunit N
MTASVIRMLYGLFLSFLPLLKYFLLLFGLISVVVGVLSALSEQKIKRILAFSSIGHSGYIILGLVPMKYSSLGASINYVVIYALTNVLIFAFLLATISAKIGNLNRYVVYVSDLSLLKNTNFFLSFCFSIALLSFAGLPPFAGFFAKFYVFYELWLAGYTFSVVLMILMSFISTYYYLRFIKCLFFSPNLRSTYLVQNDLINKVVIGLLAFFLVFYSLWAAQINLVSINLGVPIVPLHLDEYYLQYLDFVVENKVANFAHGFRT